MIIAVFFVWFIKWIPRRSGIGGRGQTLRLSPLKKQDLSRTPNQTNTVWISVKNFVFPSCIFVVKNIEFFAIPRQIFTLLTVFPPAVSSSIRDIRYTNDYLNAVRSTLYAVFFSSSCSSGLYRHFMLGFRWGIRRSRIMPAEKPVLQAVFIENA